MKPRRDLWILLAITALGAFLRFFRLDALPPGDGFDVAQYGVDALRILDGARPIFLETNFGREALFSYLVAAVYLVTGPGALGIRIAAALVGTVTIPVVYLAARELVPDRRDVLHTLPLLVALLTAVSYWHLNWSRVGLRVILVPLIASLLFTFLWRGFRRHRPLDFAVAGLLLGLGFYSYQAARLLPVLVAVAFALDALSRRAWTRQDSARVLLVTALALSVYMPLGLYARANPGVLTARIDQAVVLDATQPISPQLSTLTAQAGTALAMYGLRGDSDPLFTIPGRPSLNPFMFAFLLVGIGIAVWRWRKPTYLFLLAWLAVMTAPAMIADLAATAKRALGAFPSAVILIALGLLVPWAWLRRRENRLPARLYAIALVAGLVFTTWTTYRDYFVVWAADPDLPNHFQADHAAIGAAIGARPPQERLYLSPYPPDQPVIQLHSALRPGVRGYNGRFCLPFPDPDMDTPAATYFIVPGLGDQSLRWLQEMYPSGSTNDSPLRPNSERPMFQAFSLPARTVPTAVPGTSSDVAWANGIELTGYAVSNPAPQPAETVTVDLFYRTRSGLADLTAFVHLLGPPHPATDSPLWAQSDSPPCQGALPTSRWADGDILRDQIALVIAPDTPPGDYQLMTGFYSWPELERVPLAGSDETATPLATITVRAAE
jgi:4-amino-4-deoxy-L-arabinose transferase-like glycosyltransferase